VTLVEGDESALVAGAHAADERLVGSELEQIAGADPLVSQRGRNGSVCGLHRSNYRPFILRSELVRRSLE
jgi:hypothetical protein